MDVVICFLNYFIWYTDLGSLNCIHVLPNTFRLPRSVALLYGFQYCNVNYKWVVPYFQTINLPNVLNDDNGVLIVIQSKAKWNVWKCLSEKLSDNFKCSVFRTKAKCLPTFYGKFIKWCNIYCKRGSGSHKYASWKTAYDDCTFLHLWTFTRLFPFHKNGKNDAPNTLFAAFYRVSGLRFLNVESL